MVLDAGSAPVAPTVTAWVLEGVPAHAPLLKKLYVTVPLGMKPLMRAPMFAVSWADALVDSLPDHG